MRYNLSCINPLSKRLNVKLTLEKVLSGPLTLELSKWRPGRYEFGNFSGHIYRVQATAKDGRPIVVTKKGTHQWEISGQYTGELTISYQVYANRLDAGGTYLAEDFWLINPINCLLTTAEHAHEEAEIELDLPQGFEVSTSLRHSHGIWHASSYDELVDCPILASNNLEKIAFTVGDKPFVLAIYGDHSLNKSQLVEDFTKYTRIQNEVLPWENFNSYEYQLLFFPTKIYHGVEHKDCTTIILGPPDDKQFYENLMGVCSHELFHYWNIKRIRPKELSPYQFDEENYFDTGYVAEGFTTYYGDLFLVRGTVFDERWYLGELTRLLKRHFENYGRHEASVADSSLDLWVDGYRNEAPHRKVSIYVKGALIALMLDLTIRKCTDNHKSLDDVMRVLWSRLGPGSSGYLNTDIQSIAEELSGMDLSGFFIQFIYGVEPIDQELEELMSWVGLKLVPGYPEDQLMSYLGIKTQSGPDGYKVISTVPDSLGESHMTAGDEIIIINETPAETPFTSITSGKNIFEVIRLGKTLKIEIELGPKSYYASPTVTIDEDPSNLKHQRRAQWLNLQKDG